MDTVFKVFSPSSPTVSPSPSVVSRAYEALFQYSGSKMLRISLHVHFPLGISKVQLDIYPLWNSMFQTSLGNKTNHAQQEDLIKLLEKVELLFAEEWQSTDLSAPLVFKRSEKGKVTKIPTQKGRGMRERPLWRKSGSADQIQGEQLEVKIWNPKCYGIWNLFTINVTSQRDKFKLYVTGHSHNRVHQKLYKITFRIYV